MTLPVTARPRPPGAAPALDGRELLEAAALLVGLGFSAVVFTELSDRLRRRLLARIDQR